MPFSSIPSDTKLRLAAPEHWWTCGTEPDEPLGMHHHPFIIHSSTIGTIGICQNGIPWHPMAWPWRKQNEAEAGCFERRRSGMTTEWLQTGATEVIEIASYCSGRLWSAHQNLLLELLRFIRFIRVIRNGHQHVSWGIVPTRRTEALRLAGLGFSSKRLHSSIWKHLG